LAAGGTLGILIPPSIIMVLYGALVEESIARLFMAGVLPGLLMAGIFMIFIAILLLLKPHYAPSRDAAGAAATTVSLDGRGVATSPAAMVASTLGRCESGSISAALDIAG